MEEIRHGTVIVGGGLAGSTLGYRLLCAGRDVTILELKDVSTKNKLCAGMLIPRALDLLCDAFGRDALGELVPRKLTSACRWFGRWELVEPTEYAAIRRSRLDSYCLSRYLDAGGRVLDRVKVSEIDTAGRFLRCVDLRTRKTLTFCYDTLVGADGANSTVRRLLVGPQRQDVALEGIVPLEFDGFRFAYEEQMLGYCWYIPRDLDATVGCMLRGRYEHSEVRKRLMQFCQVAGFALPELRGAPIPSGDDVLLAPAADVYLVGDAAGLADAIGGGGIHFALESALALADYLEGGTPYEVAMAPTCAHLAKLAHMMPYTFALNCNRILREGHSFGRTGDS